MKDWKKILTIASLVALSSELYWNIFSSSFRISLSVILLPVLLMTLGKNLSTVKTCLMTACTVLLFRILLASSGIADATNLILLLWPNAAFYVTYGILFSMFVPYKHTCSYKNLIWAMFACDLTSNIVELCIFETHQPGSFTTQRIGVLALVALFRSLLALLFLLAETQYRNLLKREEHEHRYRRPYGSQSGLRSCNAKGRYVFLPNRAPKI